MAHDPAEKKNVSAENNISDPPGASWLPEIHRGRNHDQSADNKTTDDDVLRSKGLRIHRPEVYHGQEPGGIF